MTTKKFENLARARRAGNWEGEGKDSELALAGRRYRVCAAGEFCDLNVRRWRERGLSYVWKEVPRGRSRERDIWFRNCAAGGRSQLKLNKGKCEMSTNISRERLGPAAENFRNKKRKKGGKWTEFSIRNAPVADEKIGAKRRVRLMGEGTEEKFEVKREGIAARVKIKIIEVHQAQEAPRSGRKMGSSGATTLVAGTRYIVSKLLGGCGKKLGILSIEHEHEHRRDAPQTRGGKKSRLREGVKTSVVRMLGKGAVGVT
ncbi:hypothetical protein FB451DRAFT_1178685 [Mycena latifolia]|nr:hypothetical protein FB451DRAFT_1178685 [Mycena latifolia]